MMYSDKVWYCLLKSLDISLFTVFSKKKICIRCGMEYNSDYTSNLVKCKECLHYLRTRSESDRKKDNKEACLRASIRRYYRNKDKCRKTMQEYFQKNKDKHMRTSAKYTKDRRNRDLLFATTLRVRQTIKSAIHSRGFTKKSKASKLLGATWEEVIVHIGLKPEGNYHLDHICPCSQAKDEEELIKLQHYTNLRWLPAEENLKKHSGKTQEGETLCLRLLGRGWDDS